MEAVADYQLVVQLGRGTAGRTFLADPPARLGLGEPCVVKVLDRPVTDDEFQRVADELEVVASLRGARVVEVFEVGEHRGQLYSAQRFYPERGLDAAGERSADTRLRAVADAAHGVHALHEIGIVHRQVTPANVLLAGGRGLVSEPSLAPLVAPGITSTGTGTLAALAYLEPEVIWGEPAGRSSDIWSLGVTLHQALTGRSVYPDLPDETAAAFRHVLHSRPVLDERLPGAAREVIERCLAARRADRYATALDVAQALAHLATPSSAPAETAGLVELELPGDARVFTFRGREPHALDGRVPLPVEGSVEVAPPPGGEEVIVQGRRCARGHLNNPIAVTCARCGIKLVEAAGALVEGVRPPLGVLTLDDGSAFALTGDVVVGREPAVDDLVVSGRARPLRITDDERTVSRAHALIRLVGWDVLLEDRASANGTFVRTAAHQPWRRLEPDERVTLTAGASVRLGERELGFEQHSVL
jgi:hypothetical protein